MTLTETLRSYKKLFEKVIKAKNFEFVKNYLNEYTNNLETLTSKGEDGIGEDGKGGCSFWIIIWLSDEGYFRNSWLFMFSSISLSCFFWMRVLNLVKIIIMRFSILFLLSLCLFCAVSRRDEESMRDEWSSTTVLPPLAGVRSKAGHPRPKADLGTLNYPFGIDVCTTIA